MLDGIPGGALVGTGASNVARGGDNPTGRILAGARAGTDAAASAHNMGSMLASNLGSIRIGALTFKLQTSIKMTRWLGPRVRDGGSFLERPQSRGLGAAGHATMGVRQRPSWCARFCINFVLVRRFLRQLCLDAKIFASARF